MKLRKRRKFTNRKKEILYISLFFMLLFISIGYAYLSRSLSITGQTEISANSWDIHFANLSVTEGSVTATTPAAIQSDTTSINYSVLLDKPGDFYEFEVDVVNAGTIGGKLGLSSIQGISTAAEPYLESSIKYTNGNPVAVDDLLNPGSSKRIVVRVGYKEDLDTLPDSNLILDLVFNANYSQTNEEEITTTTLINDLKTNNSSCFTKYTGQVTDQPGQTVTATNVYFDKCIDKRNVIFNNMCWQVIRTTETGGLKMIYNGEPVDGKCEKTRGDHKGIVGASGSTQVLNSTYLYGTSFTYNTTTNEFTLVDTSTATWSDSTYENLIGKFTCMNTTGTCTTLYNVSAYSNNTTAHTLSYTIGDTNYAQIGISLFNDMSFTSISNVGYMFNKVYEVLMATPISGALTGYDVSYSNGTYTLLPASGESTLGTTIDSTHHYTCNNTTGTCSKVRYYNTINNSNQYLELDGGVTVEEAINTMLNNNDVNRYNSSIKGIIDAWYAQNLSSKTSMLEDTVYCNDRSIQSYGGWDKDGSGSVTYKNLAWPTDLICLNETDQFTVSNNKAKLTYPVGLIGHDEFYKFGYNSELALYIRSTGAIYYVMSPMENASVRWVLQDGYLGYGSGHIPGVRPAVSLASGVVISSGTGSETDPWIVE